MLALVRGYPGNAEKVINAYLHLPATEAIFRSALNAEVPVSSPWPANAPRRNKFSVRGYIPDSRTVDKSRHAKDFRWFKYYQVPMGVLMETVKDVWYLYFVHEGVGTSSGRGRNPFMERGADLAAEPVIDQIAELLQNRTLEDS